MLKPITLVTGQSRSETVSTTSGWHFYATQGAAIRVERVSKLNVNTVHPAKRLLVGARMYRASQQDQMYRGVNESMFDSFEGLFEPILALFEPIISFLQEIFGGLFGGLFGGIG